MSGQYRFKWWALIGISLLAFTAFLDFTIVNTALPFIQATFQADILQLQWVANIFPIILSMTMIAVGKLADLWQKKRVFHVGVCFFAFAAFGAGMSSSIEMLIFFRGLQALGASIIFITSAALISEVFPESQRVQAISIYGGVTGLGMMVGPFFGGILIALLGWKWVFWINLPLIAIGLLFCSFSVKGLAPERQTIKIDWLGLALLILGLGSLMYGIIQGAQTDWASVAAWVFLCLGILFLAGLILLDRVSKNPLLDFEIFHQKLMILCALSCSVAGMVSYVFMFFDPLYLRQVKELSPFTMGLLIAVIPAAQTVISFVFNRSVKLFGLANLFLVSIGSALISVFLHRFLSEQTPLAILILPFFLLGVNWGLTNAAMIASINEIIRPQKVGETLGTIATIWNILGALFLASSTAIFHGSKGAFLPAFYNMVDFNLILTALILAYACWIRINRMAVR